MNSLMVRNFVKFKLCDLISCCGQLPMFFLPSSSPLSPPPSPFSLILPFSPIPFYVRSHVHQNAERSHGKRYSRDERYHTSHLYDHAIIFLNLMIFIALFSPDALEQQKAAYERELAKLKEKLDVSSSSTSPTPPVQKPPVATS